MLKLLCALGLTNLAFNFPTLTALTLIGVYFYQNTSSDEKQQITQTMSSIYSNSKLFIQYLNSKAKELNLTLPDLRKKIVIDLEVPEAVNNSNQDNNIFETITENWTEEEKAEFIENELLRDKVKRLVTETINEPTQTWVEATLADCLLQEDSLIDYKKDFTDWNINVDWNKLFTQKDFRQLTSKLKAVGRASDGSIIDSYINEGALLTLQQIKGYFTNYA